MINIYKASLDSRISGAEVKRKKLVASRKSISEQIKEIDSELDFYRTSRHYFNKATAEVSPFDDVPF